MKKIIELAEKICNGNWDNVEQMREALAEYKELQQTPITEEWLKEHGFNFEHFGTWSKILHQWNDCDNFTHTIGISVSSQNIYSIIDGEKLSLMVNANSKGFLAKNITSLADIYDAIELLGITLEE